MTQIILKKIGQLSILAAATLSMVACAPPKVASAKSTAASTKDRTISAQAGYIEKSNKEFSGEISAIRREALVETATTLGAQGGLAWRSEHIDQALTKEASYLDRIFNFRRLMINNRIVPPVLVSAQNTMIQSNADTLRLNNQMYKILKQAHFSTTSPNWRNYLWMRFAKPDAPNHSLLPRNNAETTVWNDALKKGWRQGLTQGNEIFSANLNRLKRDYTGMALYRKLLAQKMVSAPFMSQSDLGVTGNNKQIFIGDRILRITAHSKLQTNSNKWHPVVTK